jgi:uncharacterized iron-regulated membrane protein
MNLAILSRRLHKWLALFVGLQLVLWTLSGVYMVAVDLDFIHGDSLVRNLRVPLATGRPTASMAEISQRYPEMTQIAMRSLPGFADPVYEVTTRGRKVLLNAISGERISPLSADRIRELARSYYAGKGELVAMSLIERDPPAEVQARALPLWRVDFDDRLQTSFYLHPDTGTLATRRHRFWRWFDFLWMLHIMDYETRDDVNNAVLRAATALGATTVLSGLWLTYFSFRRRRSAVAKRT